MSQYNWCPINHDFGVCEICDRIREEDIREGTYRDDDIEKIIQKDKIKQFKVFVLNEMKSKKSKILEDIYLSYKNAFFECSPLLNKCLLFLLDCGLGVDACGKDRWTILRMAQCYSNIELCILLIKKGANVNSKDYAGVSNLHAAVHMDLYLEIILLLLKNGANPNEIYQSPFKSEHGGTLLHLFSDRCHPFGKYEKVAIKLLLKYGADPKIKYKTPLSFEKEVPPIRLFTEENQKIFLDLCGETKKEK